jgi:hypothetical protein
MKRLLLLVVALGVITLTGLTVSREDFSALLDSLVSSSIDLAVEVKPLRNEPNSKYGNITITQYGTSPSIGAVKPHAHLTRWRLAINRPFLRLASP